MPIAPSATAAAPAPGVITTAMPRAVAAATSTRSTPTPVRAMTCSRGALPSSAWSTRASARTMAPEARPSSVSPGSGTNRQCPSSTPVTSAGSTDPSATTTGWPDLARLSAITVPERGAGHPCHRVPGAVPGRVRRGRDDLGVGQRLGDGGVALLPAAGRDQELPGLDDLEVVIAHAVARPWLEPAVVAQVRIAQDGGVPVVGAAPAQAQPQLVHLLEVPDGGAVG